MYFNEEYTWQQFQNLEGVKKLPLQEQIKHYNKYLSNLSIQRSLVENYVNQNTFQANQASVASAAGAGGNPVTASYYVWNFAFAATSASACYSASAFPTTIYYTPSLSLDLGNALYTNSNLAVAATASSGFYSYNNAWFRVTGSGVIAASGSCVGVATPFGLAYNVDYIASGTSSACISSSTFPQFNTNYYLASIAGNSIDLNDVLYTNSSLTLPVPSGSYSNGTKWYRVSGSGVVRSSGSCS
jgi:hypothetical protein